MNGKLCQNKMAAPTLARLRIFARNSPTRQRCKHSFHESLSLKALRSISTCLSVLNFSDGKNGKNYGDDKQTRLLRVAVIGEPNSGKSTLTNSLVGNQVSVVTNVPHTTRQRTLGVYTEGIRFCA